jgi:methylenetetrahydrofolate--tRNA-(uracil-5-)-methyltransferase
MTGAKPRVVVIGGGLAGSEAAWQAARLGVDVTLYEMRPGRMTEAHRTGLLAELVCSNSFKSDSISNSNGLLKVECRMLGSLVMAAASRAQVPAGSALCVDRGIFASEVTHAIESCETIKVVRQEALGPVTGHVNILAPGPLVSEGLAGTIETMVGSGNLFFYDAVSPIIDADSIDMSKVYRLSRYGKGESTYINIPLDHGEYLRFLSDLLSADLVEKHDFEHDRFFSACMPIEELAKAGDETLAHGCMKPVGLEDPRTGRRPHAVVQLRPENLEGTLYGMVGFQTRLKHGEQRRVLRKLPGLERASFARLGSIHRNTYVNSPSVLLSTLEHRRRKDTLFAGQITGAEGYAAAVATGLLAGVNAARKAQGRSCVIPPQETMLGGLARHVSGTPVKKFQPMNPNFGLLPRLGVRVRDRQRRNLLLSERSVKTLRTWIGLMGLPADPDDVVSRSGVLP